MLVRDLIPKLRAIFPVKSWEKGKTIEELAHSAGEQKVIGKIVSMIAIEQVPRGSR